jgi:hypothetical protein
MNCELCKMSNLAPDHWMSFMHMDLEIKADRTRLEELNKDA